MQFAAGSCNALTAHCKLSPYSFRSPFIFEAISNACVPAGSLERTLRFGMSIVTQGPLRETLRKRKAFAKQKPVAAAITAPLVCRRTIQRF
jgi:hypothetical protein